MSLFGELKRRNVLRVAAAYAALSWLVIQVVETTFPVFGLSETAVRVVIIVLAIGFLPVLVLAWAFELTPEGMKRDSEVDHASPSIRRMGKRMDRIIMLVLVLALGYFGVDKFVLDPAQDAQELAAAAKEARQQGRTEALVDAYGDKSIAVLPFLNMSSDPEQEYFADGIAEEMLNLLARIRQLRVISRSSAFSFKGQDIDIPTIAKRLDVAYILEGSVRRSGNSIRITAQLIEAGSDTHIWSQTYDRQLDDIFKIQDDVAAQVVEQLRLTLLDGPPQAAAADPQAYALLLQARHIMALQLENQYEHAEALLKRALEIDPGYIDALADLSLVYGAQRGAPWSDSYDEYSRLMEETQTKVLAADPTNPRVSMMLAWELIKIDENLNAAAALLEKVAAVHPTDSGVLFMSAILAENIGRMELAISLGEYAAARDPLFFWAQLNLADYYFAAGRIDDALRQYEVAISLNPNAGAVHWKTGLARLAAGDPDGAIRDFEREDPSAPYKDHGLALAYHDQGRDEESAALLQELVEKEGEVWSWGLARAYAWIGDADEAFNYLQKTAAGKAAYLHGAAQHPLLQKLHSDPRWMPFLRSIGQTPEQLADFEFNVRVPE